MSMLGKMLGIGRSEHYDRGIRMFDQSLYEEAIVEFGRVVESPERDAVSERLALFYTAEAHASLGHRALKRGAWERALAHYEKALAIHPQYADLHFSQALALRRRLEYSQALESLDLNPSYADVNNHLGLAACSAGRREYAVAAFSSAVSSNPAFVEAWINLGVLCRDLGRESDARRAFARSLELDYSHPLALANL